jgi:hypothetical protein
MTQFTVSAAGAVPAAVVVPSQSTQFLPLVQFLPHKPQFLLLLHFLPY